MPINNTGPFFQSQFAELFQLSLNGGIAGVCPEQLAKPFRLFPALDFQDLGSRRGEQFLSRLDAGNPARRLLFCFLP
jgi:hypothetical protein